MPKRRTRNGPTPDEARRAERIRDVIDALAEVNRHIPVIVEGRKDARALRKLGLAGEIITFHNGSSIYDFTEDVAARYDSLVLLTDWDRTGEALMRELSAGLEGHWEEHARFREVIKALSQKEIKDIEGIPKLLRRLEGPAPRVKEPLVPGDDPPIIKFGGGA